MGSHCLVEFDRNLENQFYCCRVCRTHIALSRDCTGRSEEIRQGFFSKVVNLVFNEPCRSLVDNEGQVDELHCARCNKHLGWGYESHIVSLKRVSKKEDSAQAQEVFFPMTTRCYQAVGLEVVQDQYGNMWPVSIETTANGRNLVLKNWPEFRATLKIELGDQMELHYNGMKTFTMLVNKWPGNFLSKSNTSVSQLYKI